MYKRQALLLVLGCKSSKSRDTLRIAAASNQALVMQELISGWEKLTGYDAELITGSTGKLTAQISSGAPFDVFLAADRIYVDRLLADNKIKDSISTYAYGKLAVIGENIDADIDVLIRKSKRIAIANPDIAPYGRASLAFLRENTASEDWSTKLAYAENVAQVHQYVYTGAADIGITALGLIELSKQSESDFDWLALEGSYEPVEQLLTILASTHLIEESSSFRSYLMSEEGQSVLISYGFISAADTR